MFAQISDNMNKNSKTLIKMHEAEYTEVKLKEVC